MAARNGNIDIMKGILIVLVVLGHSGFAFANFIHLFRVPLFFMLAGYCYSERYSSSLNSLRDLLVRRLKTLYLPYVAWNGAFALLHNSLIKLGLYTNDVMYLTTEKGKRWGGIQPYDTKTLLLQLKKIACFTGSEQLTGASWFLRTLFQITMMYAIVDFLLKKMPRVNKDMAHTLLGLGLLCIGYLCSVNHVVIVNDLEIACSSYILYALGKTQYLKKLPSPNLVYIIISLLILLGLDQFGSVALAENSFKNPLFLLVASISGWVLVSGLVEKFKNVSVMAFFEFSGRNTLAILFLHFVSFKIVTLIQITVYSDPSYMLASFPVLRASHWSLLYCFMGVVVPLGVNYSYKYSRNQILQMFGGSVVSA